MMKIGACTLLCTLRYIIVEVNGLMYNVIELGIYLLVLIFRFPMHPVHPC